MKAEHMDNSSDTTPQSSATPTPVKGSVVSQRRRRFIQAGAVPIGLTLASRPAMAWHCNTTSAWGSAVLRNGGASVQARAAANVVRATECWTVENWGKNTARTQVMGNVKPWKSLQQQAYSSKTVAELQAGLTVAHLFTGGLRNVGSNANVYTLIKDTPTSYGAVMCVARLNTLYAGNDVASCVMSSSKDMLLDMAAKGPGVFKPTNSTGAAWTETDIRTYLTKNYLAIQSE